MQLLLTGHDQAYAPPPRTGVPSGAAASGESFADYLVCFGESRGRVVSTGARR